MNYYAERINELTDTEAESVFNLLTSSIVGVKLATASNARSDLHVFCGEILCHADADRIMWLAFLVSGRIALLARFRVARYANAHFGALIVAAQSRISRGENWVTFQNLGPSERRKVTGALAESQDQKRRFVIDLP